MANTKQQDAASRLAAMRERMAQHHSSSGGVEFFSLKPGNQAIIRILPEVGSMGFPWQEIGKHELFKGDGGTVYCPAFTTNNERPCPICELADAAYREGDSDTSKALRVRRNFHMNVLVRGGKDANGAKLPDEGPKVWTPGIKVFEKLAAILGDPEYGNITDTYIGFDILVKREGAGLDSEYHMTPRRHTSSIDGVRTGEGDPDEEAITGILNGAKDLAKIVDKLPSYDELSEKLGALANAGISANAPQSSEDEEF